MDVQQKVAATDGNAQDDAAMGEVVGRYRLDLRMETVPELIERNGLQPPF